MGNSPPRGAPFAALQGPAASTLVCFTIGERTYALALEHVKELLRMVAITPLSNVPSEVVGAINLRGHIIPVISLRARMGLPSREPTLTDRIMVVHAGEQTVGLLVDGVEEVVTAEQVEVQSVAVDPTGQRTSLVAQLHDRSIPVLEPEMLYAPEEMGSVPISRSEGMP
ncbi:MAG TPA: chemotaxis protein CheW [bacterium]|nr:chemotaxis protein CheW [bacterium]